MGLSVQWGPWADVGMAARSNVGGSGFWAPKIKAAEALQAALRSLGKDVGVSCRRSWEIRCFLSRMMGHKVFYNRFRWLGRRWAGCSRKAGAFDRFEDMWSCPGPPSISITHVNWHLG